MTEALSMVEQHNALLAVQSDANEAKAVAHDRLRAARDNAAVEVTADLRAWAGKDPLRPTHQRDPSKVEEHQELSKAFCEAIIERGLLLEPIPSANGWALTVSHPGGSAEVDAATVKAEEARIAVRDFEREHGEALVAERIAAEAAELQELLATDPAGFRDAIVGRADALTSDDLSSSPSRVTRPG